jgi:hypothetical protein
VRGQLADAFAKGQHLSRSYVAGTTPGSVYYAHDPATHAFWALAQFTPSTAGDNAHTQFNGTANDPYVQFQDGPFVFTKPDGGSWVMVGDTGGLVCPPRPPASVLALWGIHNADCPPVATLQPCALSDLAFDYYSGGLGMGSDFGEILIRDISPQPCTFSGAVGLTGVSADGTPRTATQRYSTSSPLSLSARTPALDNNGDLPTGATAAHLHLAAGYRDDPTSADGLCTRNEVVPASFRLTLLGGTRLVPNVDDQASPGEHSLFTCKGQLDTPTPIGPE